MEKNDSFTIYYFSVYKNKIILRKCIYLKENLQRKFYNLTK